MCKLFKTSVFFLSNRVSPEVHHHDSPDILTANWRRLAIETKPQRFVVQLGWHFTDSNMWLSSHLSGSKSSFKYKFSVFHANNSWFNSFRWERFSHDSSGGKERRFVPATGNLNFCFPLHNSEFSAFLRVWLFLSMHGFWGGLCSCDSAITFVAE